MTTDSTPPWDDAPRDSDPRNANAGARDGFSRRERSAQDQAPTPGAAQSPRAIDEADTREARRMLTQARREALVALQRLEDAERRAATDARLQDDRLHLRLDAIGESRRRLIAVLPLSPGGGLAPLPWRDEDEGPQQAADDDRPEVSKPAAGLPIGPPPTGRSSHSQSSTTGAKAKDKARARGPLQKPRLLLILAAAFCVVAIAYILGSLQRQAAEAGAGATSRPIPSASEPAPEGNTGDGSTSESQSTIQSAES